MGFEGLVFLLIWGSEHLGKWKFLIDYYICKQIVVHFFYLDGVYVLQEKIADDLGPEPKDSIENTMFRRTNDFLTHPVFNR